MNAFDKVIGFDYVKKEMYQLCDMIHNREIYKAMGAKLPTGLLLYGEPGMGKTLIARCFIEESGWTAFTVRRDKGSSDFTDSITSTFEKAKKSSPCIVFLDDLDKFANEDLRHRDAPEYVAVQSGIDEVADHDVFVLATANDIGKLPDSLIRAGRFDRKIEMETPDKKDSAQIIRYFLSGKRLSDDVNFDDLTKMISYKSCAELEAILNEAVISAAYARRENVGMDDLVSAVLHEEYEEDENCMDVPDEEKEKIALHEAGHLVVCEMLCPQSVGLASLRFSERNNAGGFIRQCEEFSNRSYSILVSLAGKAAVELYYSGSRTDGCWSDIKCAVRQICNDLYHNGTGGFGMLDVSDRGRDVSESLNSRNEAVVQAELERYFRQAKDILLKNRKFLESAADELAKKGTLLFSDIQRLRCSAAAEPDV